jgi:hypothetical protein
MEVKTGMYLCGAKVSDVAKQYPFRLDSGFRRNDGGELDSGAIKLPWLTAENAE